MNGDLLKLWEAFIQCLDRICRETKGEELFQRLKRLLIPRASYELIGRAKIEADILVDSVLYEAIWKEELPQSGISKSLIEIKNPTGYLLDILKKRCIDRNRQDHKDLDSIGEGTPEVRMKASSENNKDWEEVYRNILNTFSSTEKEIWHAYLENYPIDGMTFFDGNGQKYGRVRLENTIERIRKALKSGKNDFLS